MVLYPDFTKIVVQHIPGFYRVSGFLVVGDLILGSSGRIKD